MAAECQTTGFIQEGGAGSLSSRLGLTSCILIRNKGQREAVLMSSLKLRSRINVFIANDVIFPDVGASLYFDQNHRYFTGVFHAMYAADR